jgi:hypothetical protein
MPAKAGILGDCDLAANRDDVVLVHLNHRLVQMCLRLLRAEVWAPRGRDHLRRVTARLVSGNALDAPAVVGFGRLLVLGSDTHRLHEEVIVAGGVVRTGRLSRLTQAQLNHALAAATPTPAPPVVRKRLQELWPALSRRAAYRSQQSDAGPNQEPCR